MEAAPDLLTYWRVIHKRRWTVITIFFVVFTVTLIGTLKQTPVYRASALLEIQKENPEILTAQELFELDSVSDMYLETQYNILHSTSLARRVIDQLALYKYPEFNPPGSWFSRRKDTREDEEDALSLGEIAGLDLSPDEYHATLESYMDRLAVDPVKRSRLVQVSFECEDPELAANVVNVLASGYIEQALEARWLATQQASEWLSQQLLGLKARLERSEEELQKYARENSLLFVESEEGRPQNIVNERLRNLQDELTKAQSARFAREGLYRLVEAGDYDSLPGVADNELMQDLTLTLAQLQRERAELLTTFTDDYPRVKRIQSQIAEIEGVLMRERERAAHKIANEYRAALARESLLEGAFERQQREADAIAERSVRYNILKREVDTNRQLYHGLLQRLREAGVSAGLKASNVRIVDPAVTPIEPAKPRVWLNMALAVFVGLGLGVGIAFLQENLDNTLKSAEDVERFLRLPALALIPSLDSLNGKRGRLYGSRGNRRLLPAGPKEALTQEQELRNILPGSSKSWIRIDSGSQVSSLLSEAFRSLRTSVLLSTAGHPPRSLLVTSSQPGEGKTTIATNLGISLTQLGERVLLIDGDLRRPCAHKCLGISNTTGLVSYLTGHEDWRRVSKSGPVAGLDVLPCGPIPPNPAELLSSERMASLLREATAEYGFVVVDSAPLLNVADSRILAALVEGTVLVVRGNQTPRELPRRSLAHLRDVGGNVIGVVLNNLIISSADYYSYHYYQEDGSDESTEESSHG